MTDPGRKVRTNTLALAIVFSSCAFPAAVARADGEASRGSAETGLVNIATPETLTAKQIGLRADVRAFNGDENTVYVGPGVRYGLSDNWELGVSSALAQFRTFAAAPGNIRHGGSDVELAAKYATRQSGKYAYSAQIGIGLPHTPSQLGPILTLGMAGSVAPCSRFVLYVNPRAAMVANNTIVGFGFGAKIKLTNHVSLLGDYTPILTGVNTANVTTGGAVGRDVYGAALRYVLGQGVAAIDLGWTNGSGLTTGSSLTPGLDKSSAFYAALSVKY